MTTKDDHLPGSCDGGNDDYETPAPEREEKKDEDNIPPQEGNGNDEDIDPEDPMRMIQDDDVDIIEQKNVAMQPSDVDTVPPFEDTDDRIHTPGSRGNDEVSQQQAEHPTSGSSGVPSSSTRASGFVQIVALLWKNFLTKLRTPVSTFFEFLSPLLMMLILAAAYTLSDIQYRDARTYASISLDFPGPWLDILNPAFDLFTQRMDTNITNRSRQRQRNLFQIDEEEIDRRIIQGRTEGSDAYLEERMTKNLFDIITDVSNYHHRLLQTTMDDEEEGGGNDNSTNPGTSNTDDMQDFSQNYEILDSTRQQVANFLESPISIPSFETFVGISTVISRAVGVDSLPRVFTDSSFGRQWGNLLTLGTIHLSPSNDFSQLFGEYLSDTYPLLFQGDVVNVRIHDSENDALQFIDSNLDERTWALLDFANCSFEDKNYRYKIRLNYTTVPNTNEIVNYVSIGLNPGYQQYYLSGFLTLQRTINEFIFSMNQCDEDLSSVWSMPMPTAAYAQNPFFLQVGFLLGLTMVMAFLFPTSRLVKTLVEEKESRMRETLFILGVRGWSHWLSWLITALIVFFVITVTITLSLVNTVLQFSDPAYIFVYVGLFSTATIGLCFTLAALFSKAKLAAIMAPVVLFATILPRFIFFGFNRYEATVGMVVASLFPATAFAFGADIVAAYEYAEQGVQSWNASEGYYSFNTTLNMLFFDTVLYLFLGFYFDQVIPRQYGTPRPFYFFLTPSFWCGLFGVKKLGSHDAVMEDGTCAESSPNIEVVDDTSFVPRVVVADMVKQYQKKSTYPPAVNHLNLTLYESQISCLLGHNGAGKSTTVSVMTGLFPPTSGDVFIYGHSIVNNVKEARQSIGICPQHNILFNSLTVGEHLRFFMRIKGLTPDRATVEKLADEIGLTDFLNTRSAALSGGNKRKLSVSIALCADPRFLVLDEPTSAVDPASRRAIWELLREKRKGRVTLLTTHFMDEAELLADRIAVLKAGKLQCVGSPVFLKERFGLGYNLTIVIEPISEDDGHSTFAFQLQCLTDFVQDIIPGTEKVRVSGKEVTYRIPRGSENLLPGMFDAIEREKRERGIGAFGIQDSSLEEVFLQLAEDEDDSEQNKRNENDPDTNVLSKEEAGEDVEAAVVCKPTGTTTEMVESSDEDNSEDSEKAEKSYHNDPLSHHQLSPLKQIGLLYWKRFVVQKRDGKGFFFSIVIPVLVIALVLLVLMINPRFVGPGIELSPELYSVVVGEASDTGVTIGAPSLVKYEWLSSSLQQIYPFMKVTTMENVTSKDVSEELLETYNDKNGPPRFGAYVLDDSISVNIRVNWSALSEYTQEFLPFPLATLVEIMNNPSSLSNISATPAVQIFDMLQSDECEAGLLEEIDSLVASLNELSSSLNVSLRENVQQRAESIITSGNISEGPTNERQNEAWPNSIGENVSVLSSNAQILALVSNICDEISGIQGNFPELDLVNASAATLLASDLEDLLTSLPPIPAFPEGTETLESTIQATASIIHNSSSPHAVAAFNQAYTNIRYRTNCSKDSPGIIVSVNEPLPLTSLQSVEIQTILSILAAIFLLIPFGYIPGAFIVFLVKERISKSKHLQLVSGVNMTSYWISSYLWDLSQFGFLTFLVMMVFLMYGTESAKVYVGNAESFFATSIIIFGYGCSVLPFSYLMARNSKNSGSAQITVIGLLFITGFVAVNAYFIMDSISTTQDVAESLHPLFRLWPGFNLGEAFIMLASSFWEREILFSDKRPFDWDVTGKSIVLLYGLAPVYFLILLLLEYTGDGGSGGTLGRVLRSTHAALDRMRLGWFGIKIDDGQLALSSEQGMISVPLDEDAERERAYVRNTPNLELLAPVVIRDIWKAYPPPAGCSRNRKPRLAVRGLSAAIRKGETFGLLGSNGAGKSTTLGMLTSDIAPTYGEAFVAGKDITGAVPGGVAEARKHIGLCPQVDPLLDLMTGRETLKMFARLRGVHPSRVDPVVEELIVRLTLSPHADKTTESYSGGNKRKLSLGIAALVGDGGVLLIDEASSGLDPLARRKMWDLIEELALDRSAIVTTHSMEEAEALCSRVGIMAHGQFVALGTVQHLKTKYLDGYTIDMNCVANTPDDVLDKIVTDMVDSIIPGSKVTERHGRFLTFDVPRMSDVGLGVCFQRLQTMKESPDCPVENYSLSQCSLEQVFIKLVKEANEREFGDSSSAAAGAGRDDEDREPKRDERQVDGRGDHVGDDDDDNNKAINV